MNRQKITWALTYHQETIDSDQDTVKDYTEAASRLQSIRTTKNIIYGTNFDRNGWELSGTYERARHYNNVWEDYALIVTIQSAEDYKPKTDIED